VGGAHSRKLPVRHGEPFRLREKRGHCSANPIEKLERATMDETAPGILTIAQTTALLAVAPLGGLLPYVSIGLFAGLRASELAALDWREISISERTIEVTAAKAKTARGRS